MEEIFVRQSPVIELVVRGRIIGTTAEHPFFVVRLNRFVPAQHLEIGEAFLSHDGQLVTLDAVRETGRVETVYNFRIAEHHTYFVGGKEWGFSVWVHNARYASVDAVPDRLKVMAEFEVDGHVGVGVNETARLAKLSGRTPLPPRPTANHLRQTMHAEIESMVQVYDQGVRGGHGRLTVYGKEVCQMCRGDVKAMARELQLESLEIFDLTTNSRYRFVGDDLLPEPNGLAFRNAGF